MNARHSALALGLYLMLMPFSAWAQESGVADVITSAPTAASGVRVGARSYVPPEGSPSDGPAESAEVLGGGGRPPYRFLPLTCVVAPEGSGDVVVSLDQDACRISSPSDEEVEAPDRLPSPYELAWVAADRAMSVAEWPQLEIAPNRVGLTGLRSFFWLDHTPSPVTASASVPGLVVTAEAHPIRYTWNFGEGATRSTTDPGRAWTKRRPGNITHMYERRGRYAVSVEVLWQARWRMGSGAWRHLGYFSNEDTRSYGVRQMVAMLTRRR